MSKVVIIYSSKTGNTKKMAESIYDGVKEIIQNVELKSITDIKVDDLLTADGIIVGSPTYFGLVCSEIKKFFDESVVHFGKLEGKVGGAFASSANIAGGNETTILGLLQMMLVHGMVIQGNISSGHYGPVSVGFPDKNVLNECRAYGKKIGKLVKKLFDK
ncbi:MAG TPA: NAD(P)H-dependent oxidoreductase [bacterium]|nr:NAD(P)H-dependent oxidoreductase [bacterium]